MFGVGYALQCSVGRRVGTGLRFRESRKSCSRQGSGVLSSYRPFLINTVFFLVRRMQSYGVGDLLLFCTQD